MVITHTPVKMKLQEASAAKKKKLEKLKTKTITKLPGKKLFATTDAAKPKKEKRSAKHPETSAGFQRRS